MKTELTQNLKLKTQNFGLQADGRHADSLKF